MSHFGISEPLQTSFNLCGAANRLLFVYRNTKAVEFAACRNGITGVW
jgi:hypothetical protein